MTWRPAALAAQRRYELEELASYLPNGLLGLLGRKWPVWQDPETPEWNFWLGAIYRKWVRKDMRTHPPTSEDYREIGEWDPWA